MLEVSRLPKILSAKITCRTATKQQVCKFAICKSCLAKTPHIGTMIMLGSQFYLFGARDTDTTTAHVLELRVDYSVPNSTLWEDYHWEFVNNVEMAKDLQFFTEDNVIIPYKVCEHCLTPGY